MNQPVHTVSQVVQMFRSELFPLYPMREIEQFIAIAFGDIMNLSKTDVHLKHTAQVPEMQYTRFEAILQGLRKQRPIQYLLGHTVFYGLPIRVNPTVLIPRPETEELVHWASKMPLKTGAKIIDLGTGSGCIALALKDKFPHAVVYGVDKSVDALNTASENAALNGMEVSFFQFDIISQQSLGFMHFDLMVSNPPYVTYSEQAAIDANVLDNEPHLALFVPDEDPLLFYRKLVDLADGHLNRGGFLFFETNRAYGSDVAQLLRDRNYAEVELRKDFNGNPRMVRAVKP